MSADFDQVKSALDEFAEAWKANDGAALGRFFVDEGTLINPFGHRADGRPAVAALYSEYFGGMLSGTSTTIALASVHAVESDHAFADAEQTVRAADGSVLFAVNLAALLRRTGDGWRFVDARPYVVATLPG